MGELLYHRIFIYINLRPPCEVRSVYVLYKLGFC